MNNVSQSKQHIEKCVYCVDNPGITDDHVPPKSFFPQPRPSNLITVPACHKCNLGAGKDEDYFLATFMFSEAGITDGPISALVNGDIDFYTVILGGCSRRNPGIAA